MRRCSTVVMLRLALAAGTIVPLQGCSRWQVEPVPPQQLVEQRRPGQVQLRRREGEPVVLERPWVEGDSLAGLRRGDTTRVAAADVTEVAVRRFSAFHTAGLTIVAGGLALGLLCVAVCEVGPSSFAD